MKLPVAQAITLKRRPVRTDDIKRELIRAGLPYALVWAVDGLEEGADQPDPGHWGCKQSHLRLWAAAIEANETIFVVEDDAVLVRGFRPAVQRWLEMVPDDWDLLLLGGLHVARPVPVSPHVVRVKQAHFTHCYLARPGCLPRLTAHVAAAKAVEVDVSMAQLYSELNVYAPTQWFASQRAGFSDILLRDAARTDVQRAR